MVENKAVIITGAASGFGGEISDDVVSVGWDSRFARFMSDHFPIWRKVFTNSYKALHLYNVFLLRIIFGEEFDRI